MADADARPAPGTPSAAPAATPAEYTVPGLHSELITRLPLIRRDRPLLDVGCGTGAWLGRLAKQGFTRLYGIDRDIGAFQCPDAQIAEADLSRDPFPFPGIRFDLITAIELIEHLETPTDLYRLARDHLADDGHLLFTTPNIHSLVSRLRYLVTGRLGQFDDKGDPTHISPFLLVGADRTLPRFGLEIVDRWGYPTGPSRMYRRPLWMAAQILSLILPDQMPGDVLCVLVRRSALPADGPAAALSQR
jgi:SAM-dependent methyltransferase